MNNQIRTIRARRLDNLLRNNTEHELSYHVWFKVAIIDSGEIAIFFQDIDNNFGMIDEIIYKTKKKISSLEKLDKYSADEFIRDDYKLTQADMDTIGDDFVVCVTF